MEPWRKRGFVPDSDEEEELDTLETKEDTVENASDNGVDLEYLPIPTSTAVAESQIPAEYRTDCEVDSIAPSDTEKTRAGSVELATSPTIKQRSTRTSESQTKGPVENTNDGSSNFAVHVQTPMPSRVLKTYGKRSSATKSTKPNQNDENEVKTTFPNQDDAIWDIPSSPVADGWSARKSRHRDRESTPRVLTPTKLSQTPAETIHKAIDPQQSGVGSRSRSSSLDELNLVEQPVAKQAQFKDAPEPDDSEDDSPLSSPPSSLHSPVLEAEQELANASGSQQDLLARIPRDIEIPQQLLDQIQANPPTQRSLRERNAIQIHPYRLEDATYQRFMKQVGLRPVRMAHEEQRKRAAPRTDEGPEQDEFNPDLLRSSPPPEEFLAPARPGRRQDEETNGNGHQNHRKNRSPIRRTPSSKRRRKSVSGAWLGTGPKEHAMPQVVIQRTPPTHRNDTSAFDSLFDIPLSSPPDAEGDSSVTQTPRVSEGFRFPPGFTPPSTTTTVVPSKPATPQVDISNTEGLDSEISSEDGEDSDASQSSSAEPTETAEEREMRRIQRQTRGVLPASYIRLAQNRLERQKAVHSNHNAATQRTDSKGVARKIIRKRGQLGRPISMFDFGESDESDGGNETENHQASEQEVDKRLARATQNPFDDDQDIMEDNRIDYMLPTVPRNTSSSHGSRSLKRPKSKEKSNKIERQAKRARLKRQTRITDASYGGHRTKQSSKKSAPKSVSRSASRPAPRLGILDAPDVTSRPHHEQPQFLRIAARGARSRRDAGRQSPTRKFFQLGSKFDTADANESLREWKRGNIRQSKVVRPQSKPRKRQPLARLSNGGHRAALSALRARDSNHAPNTEPDVITVDDEGPISGENAPSGTAALPTALLPARNAAAVQPKQPERQGKQWIVRRNFAISSLKRNDPRPAATSLVERESQAASKAFNRSLSLLNRNYRRGNNTQTFQPSLPLNRYISSTGSLSNSLTTLASPSPKAKANDSRQPTITQHLKQRRRLKKSTPHRINLDADEFAQDQIQEPADDLDSFPIVPATPTQHSSFNVGGLFNWQPSYSLDFGITPLPDGIFFHESTFIGSGEFSRSLHLKNRDLDRETRSSSIVFKDRMFHWSSWNDTVSSQIGSVFDAMTIESEKCSVSSPIPSTDHSLESASVVYRSLITYVTDHLSFIDPVDRKAFVERAMGLVFRLREPLAAFIMSGEFTNSGLLIMASYNLVFANQIHQISSHPLISHELASDALDLVKASAKDVTALALSEVGIAELHRLLKETKSSERREAGIRGEFPSATALVISMQLLRSSESFGGLLADLHIEVYTKCLLRNQKDITVLEFAWHGLFTTLPLNEIDERGISRRESRFKKGNDNWNLVKKLLSPVMDSCDTNSATQPISYNSYCRVLFQRSHRLINAWGWKDCKPILDTLYDFFARKLLHNLKLEESRGSPAFLDELDKKPSLEIRAGEPCFHTLLKIIASGLRFMALKYDKKKIRNFAWRLLPNHGRVYPKEMPLRHEDLDALRNHHDLLCTLYWAVPDGCRPRLEAIRNLVHPGSSHRETCNINLKSWTRLIRFKLSTNEDLSGLEPFADWHSYFLTELEQQHANVRNEIEAQSKNDQFASKELVESTISQNQRQIEASLNLALSGLRTAVELAPSLEHAYKLISKTPFDSIARLFNAKHARVNNVVSEALQVMVAYVKKDPPSPATPTPAPAPPAMNSTEEDSQEFEGFDDWTDLDAVLVQQDTPAEEIKHVLTAFNPIVFRLVSNCFGQEICPEDAILMSVVDCWASVANFLVQHGLQGWDNYLSPFGDQSWSQLRRTMQTRKYAAHFFAVCIERDSEILTESRNLVMGTWISSLAERSSMLKFQHRLTTAILNGRPQDPMLQNLPFTTDKRDDKYHITLEDLNQRRILLFSSILSNMREHVLQLEASGSRDLSITKQEYSELLQRLMASMKENYCELGNGTAESAQGAYVEFVHRIIRFLQELTSDIKPVDPFFTDPTLFPLPTTDPRYIVAKLKRYGPKLTSNKEVQTLTMFIQSIVERATVECQQSHLVGQLYTAMKDSYEAGQSGKPTLRAVLFQCVFPAYLELAFSTPAAWLLSRPIILSISLVFQDLLLSLDTNDPACVSSLLRIYDAIFQASYRALRPLSTYPRRFRDSTTLSMLAEFLKMVSSSLVVVDYIDRVAGAADGLISYIQWFHHLSTAVSSAVEDSEPGTASDASIAAIPTPRQITDTSAAEVPQHLVTGRRLAFEDHQSYLKLWRLHDGKYYYTRQGHDSKEVSLDPEIAAVTQVETAAKEAFEDASDEFSDLFEHYEFFAA
ncbi:hypothetical protein N7520_006682 [Penicillium odoratum]|uniref:uncharacterized protein n=1 Tax=Penicillium odoratum TaxID=1167516 RepID=UPI002547D4A8|nr:uncharacterized protein N7520_006682 [Penicillium odoratum]KAJ5759526.1 hypothetical protein N7520_006682 [Penicillium odoratum]